MSERTPISSAASLEALAQYALDALLRQEPLTLIHQAKEERNGLPLPIKRNKNLAGLDFFPQDYRPLAILEYVNDVLSGAIASRESKARASRKKQQP